MAELLAHLSALEISWLVWRSGMTHCICKWIYLECVSECSSSIIDLAPTHQFSHL